MVQMATSASGWAAQESGGGAGGVASANRPAVTSTSVAKPAASVKVVRGTSCCQNMVKCGATILLRAGRLSQIWNSSSGFGALVSSSGNISACTMPAPVVSHCTSPAP